MDFDEEMKYFSNHPQSCDAQYELPDGRVITLNSERFRCPEVLFDPTILGMESDGIHRMVYQSIMKCDIDIRFRFTSISLIHLRKLLFENVVLSGGSTLFPGLPKSI
jgi:actin